MSAAPTTAWLRARVTGGPLLVLPGVSNALGARVVEDLGYEALYVSGAGIANTFFAVPDIGLVSLDTVAAHVAAIRDAVKVPLVVDADTGFGNAIGVARTVRTLERAGADAVQIEDQVSPKRCGHFEDKSVVTRDEMIQKIHAAVDARDNEILVIARTDARAVEGLESAVDRAAAYAEAGADVVFIEAPQSVQELLSIPRRLPVPHVVNLVEGGKTPLLGIDELGEFSLALFANLTLQAAVYGMQRVLEELRRTGRITDGVRDQIAPWAERQRLVRKSDFDEMDERYGSGTASR